MPVLTFDQNNGCSLPPFNLVTNKLFFFRVNVFDVELPLGTEPHDEPSKGRSPWQLRLGLPLADIFPQLLPEFSPALVRPGQRSVRAEQGFFFPASTLNRKYSSGAVVKISSADVAKRSVRLGGQ